ncbi:hypothetical protein LCGC14_1104180 [marine sediment metagenome]|uniref:HDOD domain-containing protein n=1 Tax=marine sediment metagenome TaxID=412755 RepID=A0A0F9PRU6_9ZZZZ
MGRIGFIILNQIKRYMEKLVDANTYPFDNLNHLVKNVSTALELSESTTEWMIREIFRQDQILKICLLTK